MNVIKRDILTVTNGIIVHQINPHTMGAGLALAIRKKFPKHYEDFLLWKRTRFGLGLGHVVLTDFYKKPIIIGACAQKGYGRDGATYTDYISLSQCFEMVERESIKRKLPVFLPYKIGCGLAGGDWSVVEGIIKIRLPDAFICKLGG